MFSDIAGWLGVISDIATILTLRFSMLTLRKGSLRNRTTERKFRLRFGSVEWVSFRKDTDQSL